MFNSRKTRHVIAPGDHVNPLWKYSHRGHTVSVEKEPIFSRNSRVFAMGSCFAVEIRNTLRKLGFDVYPKYFDLQFDQDRQIVNWLPKRDNINHYDTFAIRQEITDALDGRLWGRDDFWSLSDARAGRERGWPETWQDPYRRNVFARDEESLLDVSHKVSAKIAEGLEAADIVIITLGLIECWINKANGKFINTGPNNHSSEIYPRVDFHRATYQENLDNLDAVISGIWAKYPSKKIVITVSPVALAATWTGQDVVVANMASKSILRAAAAEVCCAHPDLHYWPSYEYAARGDIFEADGRHVKPAEVGKIIDAFIDAKCAQ